MIKKVEEYIRKNKMIQPGDKIVIGVSGGADSVCLLDILHNLSKKMDFKIIAVHVNHMIRGMEADRDETFVKDLCENYGIPLICEHIDIPQRAQINGESLEEAGRKARYEFFEGVEGVAKIAVAHHADDQAETVVHNIVRGSSIKGVGGIRPVRGRIIRPLLCVRRNEIEKYLLDRNINYCTDSTNLSLVYTRNKIRNGVIPYIAQNINKDVVENINELACDLTECYEFIQKQAYSIYKKCVCEHNSHSMKLDVAEFAKEPAILRREVIIMIIDKLAGTLKNITRKHINSVDELIYKNVSKQVNLPYDINVVRGYDKIEFVVQVNNDDAEIEQKPEISMVVEEFDGHWEKLTNDYTKVFDYDKIKGTLILRRRMPGDYITIDAAGRKKTLKTFFIDAKVPRKQRDSVWLLAEGSHVLWIIGYRISSAYKTDCNTKRILKVTLRRNIDEI